MERNGDGNYFKLSMEFMWKQNGLFSGISERVEWKRNGDKFIFEIEFEWNGMEIESKWNM